MNTDTIETIKVILNKCNIHFDDFSQLDGLLLPRDILLHEETYKRVKDDISSLKSIFSSSYMTALQKSASKNQKWPLLNLVRQTLKNINYKMTPIRKSDGYTKAGVKKYKRLFKIEKLKKVQKNSPSTTENKEETIDNKTIHNEITQGNDENTETILTT